MRIGFFGGKWAAIASLTLAILAAGRLPLAARQDSAGQGELPLVLVLIEKTQTPGAQNRTDPNVALRIALRDILRDSGRYRALAFSVTDPQIKRAVNERQIASADVVPPIAPEAAQRIAKAVGANLILSFYTMQEKNGLNAQARLQENTGKDDWHSVFTDEQNVPALQGKKRLKSEEIISIVADNISVRMGLPSKLPDSLRYSPDKIDLNNNSSHTISKGTGKPRKGTGENVTRATKGNEKTDPKGKSGSETPDKTTSGEKTPPVKPEKTAVRDTPPAPNNPNKNKGETFSTFSTDNIAGRDKPMPLDFAPQNVNRPDNEALAVRYRQAGDLANVITSLRRAINEKPRDLSLRRQLVQAYQDRNLFDSARAETIRAIEIAPNDAGMHKLHGDALLAQGELGNAQKAYREAIRLDPNDVTAQVALADSLLSDNQYAEAIGLFEAAAKAAPGSPLPHRRMARAFAARAAGDPTQYAASLEQVKQTRKLLPPGDIETYKEDYTALMNLLENRMRDMLEELQGTAQAFKSGKRNANEARRTAADLKERAGGAADFLDKLPPALGHDTTHAHYAQGNALLLQAVSLFRDYLDKMDADTEAAMRGAQVDAARELTVAAKRLNAKPMGDNGKASSGDNP